MSDRDLYSGLIRLHILYHAGKEEIFNQLPSGWMTFEELDWLTLQLALPGLVLLEHRSGAGAERTVIQENDVRIEEGLVA